MQPRFHSRYTGLVVDTMPGEWLLLAYRLPREPSGPRVTVWRKLRRLGALQLVDGLVALPATSQNRERFDWLADEVVDAGGEAWTWAARPGSKAQHRALAARMTRAAAADYEALAQEAQAAAAAPTRRTLDRLRRELHQIEARDPFAARERTTARNAVAGLAKAVEASSREAVR
jgi:hypothetical protein